MSDLTRRAFLWQSAVAGTAALSGVQAAEKSGSLHIATFRFDVTPPLGHACCGGWIKPVEAYDDPLEAIGFVLLGAGKPIVICAVDWTGILNDAHLAWRTALAEAAGTSPDRVAVHTVHQHNAPLVCFEADRLVRTQPDLPKVLDLDFHAKVLDAARVAVATALPRARPVTHIAHGNAEVAEVASNRRVLRDTQGRVLKMRGSRCVDPQLLALPDGPIDPRLRTVAFYDGERKVVACHYYATHPMSYYGDGRVSSDFCGLARKRRQEDEPGCTHVYFSGCAGNIAAGKYNDGTPAARVRLTERIYRGIVASEATLRPEPLDRIAWRTEAIVPAINPRLGAEALRELIQKQPPTPLARMRPAFKLALVERCERRLPFVLSALHANDIALLHLPAEPFVEYQLAAQSGRGAEPLAVAAYGDCGPWYLPTAREFPSGGYEVEHAFCAPESDDLLTSAIRRLLS